MWDWEWADACRREDPGAWAYAVSATWRYAIRAHVRHPRRWLRPDKF